MYIYIIPFVLPLILFFIVRHEGLKELPKKPNYHNIVTMEKDIYNGITFHKCECQICQVKAGLKPPAERLDQPRLDLVEFLVMAGVDSRPALENQSLTHLRYLGKVHGYNSADIELKQLRGRPAEVPENAEYEDVYSDQKGIVARYWRWVDKDGIKVYGLKQEFSRQTLNTGFM